LDDGPAKSGDAGGVREQMERVGARYDRNQMLLVREMTIEALGRIARAVEPGMAEEAALAEGRGILKKMGLLRGWHGIKVRFGPNTLKVFTEASEPGVVLQATDIFFVDIGPVWRNWEGDAGATFVVGNDADMHRCQRDVHTIFDRVRARWRSQAVTGRELYEYASAEAHALGWELNLDTSGHRIADFPHAAQYSGSLLGVDFAPATELWVLEIQIRHPKRPIGAFYEDMLIS
jgi:Xaa-Pro aminopeptidase